MTRPKTAIALAALLIAATGLLVGCQQQPSGVQFVIYGDSFATVAEAAQEANLAIERAAQAGCRAISVGGVGAGGAGETGGGLVLAVPVLIECPAGTDIITTGFVFN